MGGGAVPGDGLCSLLGSLLGSLGRRCLLRCLRCRLLVRRLLGGKRLVAVLDERLLVGIGRRLVEAGRDGHVVGAVDLRVCDVGRGRIAQRDRAVGHLERRPVLDRLGDLERKGARGDRVQVAVVEQRRCLDRKRVRAGRELDAVSAGVDEEVLVVGRATRRRARHLDGKRGVFRVVTRRVDGEPDVDHGARRRGHQVSGDEDAKDDRHDGNRRGDDADDERLARLGLCRRQVSRAILRIRRLVVLRRDRRDGDGRHEVALPGGKRRISHLVFVLAFEGPRDSIRLMRRDVIGRRIGRCLGCHGAAHEQGVVGVGDEGVVQTGSGPGGSMVDDVGLVGACRRGAFGIGDDGLIGVEMRRLVCWIAGKRGAARCAEPLPLVHALTAVFAIHRILLQPGDRRGITL